MKNSKIMTMATLSGVSFVFIIIGLFFLFAYFIQLAYNGSIRKFGGRVDKDDETSELKLPKATYWQSVCLSLLIALLFSNWGIGLNN